MLAPLSFGRSRLTPPMPMQTSGGSSENALKNEYGAALSRPCAFSDTTQAIGRGTMVDASSL